MPACCQHQANPNPRDLYLYIDQKNVLQSIDLINQEDGLQIAHIDDKTPTPGDTFVS